MMVGQYAHVYTTCETVVAAHSQRLVPLRVSRLPAGPALLTGQDLFEENCRLHTWRNVVITYRGQGQLEGGVLNTTDVPLTIPADIRYGQACSVYFPYPTAMTGSIDSNVLVASSADPDPRGQGWTLPERRGWIVREFRLKEQFGTSAEREPLLQLLLRYWDVYSHANELGPPSAKSYFMLDTVVTSPSRVQYTNVSRALETAMIAQLDAWLADEPIEKAHSAWGSTVVAISHTIDHELQWCLDLRQQQDTSATMKIEDVSPVPISCSDLGRVSTSQYFSSLDGCGVYHVYRPGKLFPPWAWHSPAKVVSRPSQRLTRYALEGMPLHVSAAYLKGSTLHSPDLASHCRLIQKMLENYRAAAKKLQPSQCRFFQQQIVHSNHRISSQGVSLPPEVLGRIKKWPIPTSTLLAKEWLDYTKDFQHFVNHYAGLTISWAAILGKKQGETSSLYISPDMRDSFHVLKQRLLQAPRLAHVDTDSASVLIVESCWSIDLPYINGRLLQWQNGTKQVIAHHSRRLALNERRYPPHQIKVLAATQFLHTWKTMLATQPFVLRIDRHSLDWLYGAEKPNSAMRHWKDTLFRMHFSVEHHHGRLCDEEVHEIRKWAGSSDPTGFGIDGALDLSAMRDEQLASTELTLVRKWVATRQWKHAQYAGTTEVDMLITNKDRMEWIAWAEANDQLSTSLKIYAVLLESLEIDRDGFLFRNDKMAPLIGVQNEAGTQLCVPPEVRTELITQVHLMNGHAQVEDTVVRLQRGLYFPEMKRHVAELIQKCKICQAELLRPEAEPLIATEAYDSYPWQQIRVTILQTTSNTRSSPSSFKFLVVLQCTLSLWVQICPVRQLDLAQLNGSLEEELFSTSGTPERMYTASQAPEMINIMASIATAFGIQIDTYEGPMQPGHNAASTRQLAANEIELQRALDDPTVDLEAVVFGINTRRDQHHHQAPYQRLFGYAALYSLNGVFGRPVRPRNRRAQIEQAVRYTQYHMRTAVAKQKLAYFDRQNLLQTGLQVIIWTTLRNWSGPWTLTERHDSVMLAVAPDPIWGFTRTTWMIHAKDIHPVISEDVFSIAPIEDIDAEWRQQRLFEAHQTPLQYHVTLSQEHDQNEVEMGNPQEIKQELQDQPSTTPHISAEDYVINDCRRGTRQRTRPRRFLENETHTEDSAKIFQGGGAGAGTFGHSSTQQGRREERLEDLLKEETEEGEETEAEEGEEEEEDKKETKNVGKKFRKIEERFKEERKQNQPQQKRKKRIYHRIEENDDRGVEKKMLDKVGYPCRPK